MIFRSLMSPTPTACIWHRTQLEILPAQMTRIIFMPVTIKNSQQLIAIMMSLCVHRTQFCSLGMHISNYCLVLHKSEFDLAPFQSRQVGLRFIKCVHPTRIAHAIFVRRRHVLKHSPSWPAWKCAKLNKISESTTVLVKYNWSEVHVNSCACMRYMRSVKHGLKWQIWVACEACMYCHIGSRAFTMYDWVCPLPFPSCWHTEQRPFPFQLCKTSEVGVRTLSKFSHVRQKGCSKRVQRFTGGCCGTFVTPALNGELISLRQSF